MHASVLSDVVESISDAIAVEQIPIRNLPAGTKAALKARGIELHKTGKALAGQAFRIRPSGTYEDMFDR